MVRQPSLAVVRHPVVPRLIRWLRDQGHDIKPILRRFALRQDVVEQEEAEITPANFGLLLEEAANRVRDPHLSLRLPAELPMGRYTLFELVAKTSPTGRAALARAERYAPLVSQNLIFQSDHREDEIVLRQRFRNMPGGLGRCVNEFILASVLFWARSQYRVHVIPRRVWFIHAPPSDLAPLHRFFGTTNIEFGQLENGIAFTAAEADRPIPSADTRLIAAVDDLVERAAKARPKAARLPEVVGLRVQETLADEVPTAAAVARHLGMSVRTLHRRLADDNTSFGEIVDHVRRELASQWLRTGTLGIADIAWRLGFANAATFSRAFKRWTGRSPGAFRVKPPTPRSRERRSGRPTRRRS